MDIKDHVELLKGRISFLDEWITHLEKNLTKEDSQYFDKKDKIYSLKMEANHKAYLIAMRLKDEKMMEGQKDEIIKKANTDLGTQIGKLREKKPTLANKEYTIADGIIKRFSKGKYETPEHKVNDYKMALAING
jgi:hypothetical protein